MRLRQGKLSSRLWIVEFLIRDYRAADFDRLWAIDQTCFPPGIAYTQMDLTGFVTRRKAITLVAEFPPQDGFERGIAGFAVAQPIRNIGRILTLDILPEARRHGLGTRLVRASESRLLSAGCKQIFLETAVTNDPAIALYEGLGYSIVRTLPLYYPTHALDGYLMSKEL
jgi:[ribosomal protein S18]-alanine N-acetyltransferase